MKDQVAKRSQPQRTCQGKEATLPDPDIVPGYLLEEDRGWGVLQNLAPGKLPGHPLLNFLGVLLFYELDEVGYGENSQKFIVLDLNAKGFLQGGEELYQGEGIEAQVTVQDVVQGNEWRGGFLLKKPDDSFARGG